MKTKIERIGEKMKRAREEAGLTLREAAEKYGSDHSTISSYESGRRTMNILQMEKLCSIYGVNYLDILSEIYYEDKISGSKNE